MSSDPPRLPSSAIATIPWDARRFPRSVIMPAISSSSGPGMNGAARSLAFSRRIPVGSPFSSLSICPPSGSGVDASMPHISSALLFSTRMCWHARTMLTGTSSAPRSRSYLFGVRCSASLPSSKPQPWIQTDPSVAALLPPSASHSQRMASTSSSMFVMYGGSIGICRLYSASSTGCM